MRGCHVRPSLVIHGDRRVSSAIYAKYAPKLLRRSYWDRASGPAPCGEDPSCNQLHTFKVTDGDTKAPEEPFAAQDNFGS